MAFMSQAPEGYSTREKDDVDFENDFDVGTTVGTSSANIRIGFLKKVYGIVSIQLLITVSLSLLVMLYNPVRTFVADSANLVLVAMLGTFVALCFLVAFRKRHPLNLSLLGIFTLFESYTIAWVCAINYENGLGHNVAQAFLLTCVVFLSLTAFCLITKKDFSFLGGFLFAALTILLVSGILTLAFGWGGKQAPMFSFLYSFFGALVFCGYILYDTSRLIHQLSPDEYALAAISIYLDIVNLFLYILRAMNSGDGN